MKWVRLDVFIAQDNGLEEVSAKVANQLPLAHYPEPTKAVQGLHLKYKCI
jgi:hypothetical protein